MSFIGPVNVDDMLCVYTEIEGTGRTSIRVHLEVWALRKRIGERVKVTDGMLVFVSIDDAGQLCPLPEVPSAK